MKRSILVEADGGPLGVVVAPANVHDAKLLAATLDAVVVERPRPTSKASQHLALDKGYDNPTSDRAVAEHGYVNHTARIRSRANRRPARQKQAARKPKRKRGRSRRWVVERTLAWLNKCRAILVRYEKKARNYLGLIKLACMLLWYRRTLRLSVLR